MAVARVARAAQVGGMAVVAMKAAERVVTMEAISAAVVIGEAVAA